LREERTFSQHKRRLPDRRAVVAISARASQLRVSLARNLEGCQDLSELVQFVASSLGDRMDTPTILTDIECSARVWRGVERVHQELRTDN
jgi:hypothetical protein